MRLVKGARATGIERVGGDVVVSCDDGRVATGSHALLAIGSIPNSDQLRLENAGVTSDGGYVPVDGQLRSNVPHIYAAGDLSGRLPLSSVASMQGRKIAEHAMGAYSHRQERQIDYDKAASAIFTEPEIADVGMAETDAFSEGRKVRVTKVPFSSHAKALINDDPRGFVKIARPCVIAKSCPMRKHIVLFCARQRPDVREAINEANEVGYDGLNLRLLQHDFRHPDAIGRDVLLPWQVLSAVLLEPAQRARREVTHQLCPGR